MTRFVPSIRASLMGAVMPLVFAGSAFAEDVVIRIEAKRGAATIDASAQSWAAQFPDVVTFPLTDGWIGIALGPMEREAATARLEELKAANAVPGDSFISPAQGRTLTPVPSAEATGAAAPDIAENGSPSTFEPAGQDESAPVPDNDADQAEATEQAAAPASEPQFFIRIASDPDRARAEELLTTWRETLPEASLWTLPNGRFGIALGPVDEVTGAAWVQAFKRADAVPSDAFLSPQEEMGENAVIGRVPELGAPPAADAPAVEMPPLEDVQRALRWAGLYDGVIDGKDGPRTQSAISAEVVAHRVSPDRATAIVDLISRREAWRNEAGLQVLRDEHTGLSLPAPMGRLEFDRSERALSIYGPRDGSGAALILFSQQGGRQEMLDIAGLVTALGWVPSPTRQVGRDMITLDGRNQTHIGHAEGRVIDGVVQGFVLIWPLTDPESQQRVAAEISDHLQRFAPPAADTSPDAPAIAPAQP